VPNETVESTAAAAQVDATPAPIEAAQAEAEASEIADAGLTQPEDEGGAMNEQRRQ
jgi:hypothetical protein